MLFGHEKLLVYQKALTFIVIRGDLLNKASRRVAAIEHLDRAGESIPLNIAHASSAWSPQERSVYLGHANGSALECAACLDVLVAKQLLPSEDVLPGKLLLREIVNMLIGLKKRSDQAVHEAAPTGYMTQAMPIFSHERLEVYKMVLRLVAIWETIACRCGCSADLLSKLDRNSTAIALNIAEGNGRFSGRDQSRFLAVAHKSVIQTSSLVDIATKFGLPDDDKVREVQTLLRHIASMLTSLSKSVETRGKGLAYSSARTSSGLHQQGANVE